MRYFLNKILVIVMMVTVLTAAGVCTASAATSDSNKLDSPANVTAKSVNYNKIKVDWSKVDDAAAYEVYRYNSNTKKYVLLDTVKSNTYYYDKELKYNKRYSYKVKAIAKNFISTADARETAVVSDSDYSAKVSTVTKLDKVRNLRGKALSSTSTKITWSRVEGADGYKVYKYSSSKNKYIVKKTIKSSKTTTFRDKNLKPSKRYSYKVAAYRDGHVEKKSSRERVRTKSSQGGSKILSKARTKLGNPYVLGASGPYSFDCSGFVYWTYKTANVTKKKVSRTTAAGMYSNLRNYKVSSSLSGAKKGDIVFYSSGGYINHVAMYYGNGKVIHAANPRRGVCIQNSSDMSYSGQYVCAVVRLPYKK